MVDVRESGEEVDGGVDVEEVARSFMDGIILILKYPYIMGNHPHLIHISSTSHPHHIHISSTSHPYYIHITSTSHPHHIHITSTSHPHLSDKTVI